MSWTPVCTLAELGEDAAVSVNIGDEPVCVARSEGKVYALRDVCSHAEIALSDGEIEDGTVECWLHGSRFELATGRPLGLPANQPVPTYPVRVDGDTVLVDLKSA
jgi:3-phenylpropionate/trans-cinnamate dioxygenase ferredoxin subunit